MTEMIKVEYIGWEDDFRFAKEKCRITEHIRSVAKKNGFTYACVQDVLITKRYRAHGPFFDVHFKRSEWIEDGVEKYVPARLRFNEDADLAKEPEFFDEVGVKKVE